VRLVPALATASLVALVLVQPAPADRDAFRAAVSFWAMRHTFYDSRAHSYREVEGSKAPAHAWPYSQALAATIAMADVPRRGRLYLREAGRRVSGLSSYLGSRGAYASILGSRGDLYYDDNEWIALDLLNWYDLRRSRAALRRAGRVFRIIVGTWDSDPTHACPGGIPWTSAAGNDDRNTVTTVTGALLGLRLYDVTHDASQLNWSKQMLTWASACLLAPDGLYWDHLGPDGSRDETHWSYNQGTAIGANVLLYKLTGDAAALRSAERLADASLAYFDRTPDGTEPPYFLAILFRNLLDLAAIDEDGDYRAAAQGYADAAWDAAHDPQSGLFRFHGSQPVQLLEQAAMVQIYAALATSDR
jgi:Glycosyl hydrolase family 76